MIHPSMHPMIHGDVVYLLHSPLSNAFGAWVCIAGDQWVGTVMFFYHGDDGIAALRWAKGTLRLFVNFTIIRTIVRLWVR